eukprot:TRINITY_DN21972_c0_g1_i1.p1 TRINITY_DN21972_c0_g1~~TRINITY_DN21972_c0_g1_i1.p1  ORF type:complete len:655 (+),score=100.58 TRINITY_DN21972_c0_g1_i1:45-2009(+)
MSDGPPVLNIRTPSSALKSIVSKSQFYVWRYVLRITSRQDMQEGILAVTNMHIFLITHKGKIKRVARISDIELGARQNRGNLGGGMQHIGIKFFAELREPSLLLELKDDKRAPPQGDALDIIAQLRKPLRLGESLPIQTLPKDSAGGIREIPEMGPWKRPEGYRTPKKKLGNGRELLLPGSCRPPVEQPNYANPDTIPYNVGDVIELTGLVDKKESNLNGQLGIFLGVTNGKCRCGFAVPIDYQEIPPQNVTRPPPGSDVDPTSVAGEYFIDNSSDSGLGIDMNGDMLLITHVAPIGPASKAGLPSMCRILQIDGFVVSTPADVQERIKGAGNQSAISFIVSGIETDIRIEDSSASSSSTSYSEIISSPQLKMPVKPPKSTTSSQERRDRSNSRKHTRREPGSSLEHALGALLLKHMKKEKQRSNHGNRHTITNSHIVNRTGARFQEGDVIQLVGLQGDEEMMNGRCGIYFGKNPNGLRRCGFGTDLNYQEVPASNIIIPNKELNLDPRTCASEHNLNASSGGPLGMGLSEDGNVITITSIAPDLPASRAGIPDGVKILRINGEEVRSVQEAVRLIKKAPVPEEVLVVVSAMRDSESHYLTPPTKPSRAPSKYEHRKKSSRRKRRGSDYILDAIRGTNFADYGLERNRLAVQML